MRPQARLLKLKARLMDIHTEQQRQMQYAGVRLGVFARLQELAREEKRVIRKMDALSTERER